MTPTLAVWKFSSCDGCQLTLLNCEEELIPLAGAVRIAYFPEATRAVLDGPYDVSLVEGSVTTPHDAERIREIRRESATLVTIGACATSGGIQALRDFADVGEWTSLVYEHPEYVATLPRSTPIREHVPVDVELPGCPVDRQQLLAALVALVQGRRPHLGGHSVCVECKRRGTVCVAVAGGTPCLGPVTRAGCGALCPAYGRGCYGCFGPQEVANPAALGEHLATSGPGRPGLGRPELTRLFRTFTAAAGPFRAESQRHEQAATAGGGVPDNGAVGNGAVEGERA